MNYLKKWILVTCLIQSMSIYALDDYRVICSEIPEPVNDEFSELIELFNMHAQIVYARKTITILPPETPLDQKILTPKFLKKDFNDKSGSDTYDVTKKNIKHLKPHSAKFFKALVARSARRKLERFTAIIRELKELKSSLESLQPFLAEADLTDFNPTAEQMLQELQGVQNATFSSKFHDTNPKSMYHQSQVCLLKGEKPWLDELKKSDTFSRILS